MSLPIGTILGHRYELRAFIGSDGTLEVYKGLDLRLGRDVALTVLEIVSIHTPEELINFEQEAQIRAGLHHPRIVTIHDFGHGAGCAFQVAEWLEGQSLRRRFKSGSISWEEARNIAEAVIEGLTVIHRKGFTLRHLDTSSVFLERDGKVWLFAYQLKRVEMTDILIAQKEGLQALARMLVLVLGEGLDQEMDPRIGSTLRRWTVATDQDASSLRKEFEALIHDQTLPPPRPLRQHWVAKAALLATIAILASLYLQRSRPSPAPAPIPDQSPPQDPEVLRLYLQGMALLESLEPGALKKGQACLQNAILKDPACGLAYSGLGKCFTVMGLHRMLTKEEASRLSQAAIHRALLLAPDLGEAQAALAFRQLWYALQWPEAERAFRRAIALAPMNASIHRDFGTYLALRGRWEESQQHFRTALAEEPLSRATRTEHAVYLHWAGRSSEALQEFAKALDQDPRSVDTWTNYREVVEQLGRFEEALRVADRFATLEILPERDALALRNAFEARGPKGYWTERVRQAERQPDPEPTRLAELVALQGDQERALRLLGRAIRDQSIQTARIPNSPALASLRMDPRFRKLLQKIGYPES